MPGIVGIISLDWHKKVDTRIHERMCRALNHRDWYKRMDAFAEEGNYAVSRIHHGILNPLDTPYYDNASQVSIILEGEIYNDLPDGMTQSEYILNSYLKRGSEFSNTLNGSFVIIVIDRRGRKIFIANDRTGSRPFLSYNDGKFLYFSPESKSIIAVPGFRKKINEDAVASFLYAGFLINRTTYFQDIEILDNASVLTIENGLIKQRRYWSYHFDEEVLDQGLDNYVRQGGELVIDAVRKRLRTEKKFGILLSGGIDSRAIYGAYGIVKPDDPPVTITWGVNENQPGSDAAYAEVLSKVYGSQHTFYSLQPESLPDHIKDIVFLNEGQTDAAGNYPEGLDVFKRLRNELGLHTIYRGDQCFGCGGDFVYSEDDVLPAQSIYPTSSSAQYRLLVNSGKYNGLVTAYDDLYHTTLKRCPSRHFHNKKDFFHLDQRLISLLNPLTYLKQIEVEVKNPLLDNDILDYLSQVPYYHRINKKLIRGIVHETFPRVASIPIAEISNDINWEKELRRSLKVKEYIHRYLIEEQNSFDEYIDKEALSKFLKVNFAGSEHDRHHWYPTGLKQVKKQLKKIRPLVMLIRKYRQSWVTTNDLIIFRLLILKNWFELFVDNSVHHNPF